MSAPTVRDVMALTPNPRMVSTRQLARQLHVSHNTAQELKDLALSYLVPTPSESRLMRLWGVNLAEVRAWAALHRSGFNGAHRA